MTVDQLQQSNSVLNGKIEKLEAEVTNLKFQISQISQFNSHGFEEESTILFSDVQKSSFLSLSYDKKIVCASDKNTNLKNSNTPISGNVFTWKVRYVGNNHGIFVGVIDDSKFETDKSCENQAHGCYNHGPIRGNLCGQQSEWNVSEGLELRFNVDTNLLVIKSVGADGISLSGTLPELSEGKYRPFFSLSNSNHVIAII
ncbi:hypothetical protein GEMRC1_012225 [Eukaryota sp. GEM-RC1]